MNKKLKVNNFVPAQDLATTEPDSIWKAPLANRISEIQKSAQSYRHTKT